MEYCAVGRICCVSIVRPATIFAPEHLPSIGRIKSRHPANVRWEKSVPAVVSDRPWVVALGEASAEFVAYESVMAPNGCRQIKQNLKEPVKMRRFQEVFAARHVADLLFSVVHHYCKVVGGSRILASEDDVAQRIEQDACVEPMFAGMRAGCFLESDFSDGVCSAEEGDGLADVQANCI